MLTPITVKTLAVCSAIFHIAVLNLLLLGLANSARANEDTAGQNHDQNYDYNHDQEYDLTVSGSQRYSNLPLHQPVYSSIYLSEQRHDSANKRSNGRQQNSDNGNNINNNNGSNINNNNAQLSPYSSIYSPVDSIYD